MGTKESIGWATKTWNPVTGCWGPGGTQEKPNRCFYCYAHRMAKRLRGRFEYPEDDPFRPTLHPSRLIEPLKWKKPKKVFLCSMGDLLGDDVPAEFIDEILEVIAACPQHTFILLTKRPENIETKFYEVTEANPCRELGGGDYLPNLWLGVTGENQQVCNERIPILLQIPAAVRFVSVEPMLGPINFNKIINEHRDSLSVLNGYGRAVAGDHGPIVGIDWIIVGSQTGAGARYHAPKKEWIEEIVVQATNSDIPIFMKNNLKPYWDGELIQEWPNLQLLENLCASGA